MIVVIGDVILDTYWHGSTRRISPESPVPVVDRDAVERRLGGAANVAANIRALGEEVLLLSAAPQHHPNTTWLSTLLDGGGIGHRLVASTNPIPEKIRVLACNHHLLRIDIENQDEPSTIAADEILEILGAVSPDAIVISDYNKGVAAAVARGAIAAARARNIPVLVDPKVPDWDRYRGATIVKPNQDELTAVVRFTDIESMLELIRGYDLGAIVYTSGSGGMAMHTAKAYHHTPAHPVEVADVTGAGDVAIAALAVGVTLGLKGLRLVEFANAAAGVSVTRAGTTTVTRDEAEAAVRSRKTVFTNGCFDVLHAGHVRFLLEARALGGRLVVAIDSDESVRRLKGPNRPINPLADRIATLRALTCVDEVVTFDQPSDLESLINIRRPDVLVKGGDYLEREILGADLVQAYGGEVAVLMRHPGYSTTETIERLKR